MTEIRRGALFLQLLQGLLSIKKRLSERVKLYNANSLYSMAFRNFSNNNVWMERDRTCSPDPGNSTDDTASSKLLTR